MFCPYTLAFSSIHGRSMATVFEPFWVVGRPLEERRETWLVGMGKTHEAVPGSESSDADYQLVVSELAAFLSAAGCLNPLYVIETIERA